MPEKITSSQVPLEEGFNRNLKTNQVPLDPSSMHIESEDSAEATQAGSEYVKNLSDKEKDEVAKHALGSKYLNPKAGPIPRSDEDVRGDYYSY